MENTDWLKQPKRMFEKEILANGFTDIKLSARELTDVAVKYHVVISVCMFCGRYLRHQASGGATGGLSHGECDVCHSFHLQRIGVWKKLNNMRSLKRFTPNMRKRFVDYHRQVEVIDNILAFRRYTHEHRGLMAKPA